MAAHAATLGLRLAMAPHRVVCERAGFRMQETLALGLHIHVEDFVVDHTAQRKGHGRAMLSWLETLASSKEGCGGLVLSSGWHAQEGRARVLSRQWVQGFRHHVHEACSRGTNSWHGVGHPELTLLAHTAASVASGILAK